MALTNRLMTLCVLIADHGIVLPVLTDHRRLSCLNPTEIEIDDATW